jgi:ribonucleoside-diphosphate reductase alpha chain
MMRERLPNRRAAETFEIEVSGLRYTATVSRFADGRIGEIFIQNSKPGSTSDCYMRDAGISASLALQYGCPLETLRRALLRDPRGAPSTPIGRALDLIAGLDDAASGPLGAAP